MLPPVPPVRVLGQERLAAAVRARLTALGIELRRDVTDAGGSILVVAGGSADVPGSAIGPLVLVAPQVGSPELRLLSTGAIDDVVRSDVSDEELVARLLHAWDGRRQFGAADWRREVEQLLGLIRDFATSGGLPALQLRIVQRLADVAGVERCSLVLFDDNEVEPLHGTVVAASDRPETQTVRIDLTAYPEVREAWRTGEPVIIADAPHNPLFATVRERIEKAGVVALAVFPLHLENKVFGVLIMRSRESFERPETFALASTAAIATALAVRQGRLVDEVRGETTKALRRYESFIAHLSDGVAVLDDQGVMVLLNPAGAAILGWPDEVKGRRLLDVAPPRDPFAAQLLFREIGRGARVLNSDLEVTLHDGRRVVLAISAGQLHMGEARAILSFRDVTEQRHTETELRTTRDFLERLIEASTDAIVAADLTGKLIVFNRAAEQLFQVSASDARASMSVRDLYPQGGAREVMRLLRDSQSGQIEAVRAYGRTHKGELVPIELSAALISVNGKETASVGLLRDLRERVRVESELARTRARLIDAEKQGAITALAGATAHELNQPLTVILMYAQQLLRKLEPGLGLNKPLEAIATEAERMSEIVKKIAKLTRIETVSYPGERQIADIDRSSEPARNTPPVRR